mmetsp:Transcript_114446/g.323575  ORF Transcript_114446/g.323575 Transcript_114446/m.323575 type:complete len:247 (+) Transcript_114446:67-807(+)
MLRGRGAVTRRLLGTQRRAAWRSWPAPFSLCSQMVSKCGPRHYRRSQPVDPRRGKVFCVSRNDVSGVRQAAPWAFGSRRSGSRRTNAASPGDRLSFGHRERRDATRQRGRARMRCSKQKSFAPGVMAKTAAVTAPAATAVMATADLATAAWTDSWRHPGRRSELAPWIATTMASAWAALTAGCTRWAALPALGRRRRPQPLAAALLLVHSRHQWPRHFPYTRISPRKRCAPMVCRSSTCISCHGPS